MPSQNDTDRDSARPTRERPQFDAFADDFQSVALPDRTAGEDFSGLVRRNPFAAVVLAAGVGLLLIICRVKLTDENMDDPVRVIVRGTVLVFG